MFRYVIKAEGYLSYFTFKLDSNYYQMTWSNGFGNNRVEFRGNVLYCIQEGNKKIESWREYSSSGMVMTITCDGHTAKKYFTPDGFDDSCLDWNGCCVWTSQDKVNLV